jgi:hypothetical protein
MKPNAAERDTAVSFMSQIAVLPRDAQILDRTTALDVC